MRHDCAPVSLLIVPEQQHKLLLVGGHLLRGLHLHPLHLGLHLLLLARQLLVLVPLQILCGAALVPGGLLGCAAWVEGRCRGLVRAGQVLVDERGNERLQINSVQLTDIVEIVLDVRQQRLLLRINILEMQVHLVGRGHRVLRLFVDGVTSGGGSLLLMLVHECLDRHGRILVIEWARIFLLLDGLADDTDGCRALLLVLLESLAQLAYLRGQLGKVGQPIGRCGFFRVSGVWPRAGEESSGSC